MTVDFEWLVPQHVSYARFYEEVTIADLEISNSQVMSYARQVPAPRSYHAVFDCLLTSKFPLQLSLLLQDKLSAYRSEPNLGYIIIVSTNSVIQLLGGIVLRLRRNRFQMVRTMDDGIGFLKEKDTHINWKNANAKFAGRL